MRGGCVRHPSRANLSSCGRWDGIQTHEWLANLRQGTPTRKCNLCHCVPASAGAPGWFGGGGPRRHGPHNTAASRCLRGRRDVGCVTQCQNSAARAFQKPASRRFALRSAAAKVSSNTWGWCAASLQLWDHRQAASGQPSAPLMWYTACRLRSWKRLSRPRSTAPSICTRQVQQGAGRLWRP